MVLILLVILSTVGEAGALIRILASWVALQLLACSALRASQAACISRHYLLTVSSRAVQSVAAGLRLPWSGHEQGTRGECRSSSICETVMLLRVDERSKLATPSVRNASKPHGTLVCVESTQPFLPSPPHPHALSINTGPRSTASRHHLLTRRVTSRHPCRAARRHRRGHGPGGRPRERQQPRQPPQPLLCRSGL